MNEELFSDKHFGAETEMSSLTVDWGKPGDFIVGTFIKSRHNIETQYGENSIYEILADRGEFHKLVNKVADKDVTKINKGEIWAIWGRNDLFNGQMETLKVGQVVKIHYAEDKKSSKGNPAKIIKISAPKNNKGEPVMNETYLAEQELT